MEEKLKKLETEIQVLNERVKYLEKKETRRRNLALFKFLISLGIIIFIFLTIYEFYQKISEITSLIPFF